MLGPAHKTASSCSLSLEACCIKTLFTTMDHKCLQDKNPFETNCQSVWVFDGERLFTHTPLTEKQLLPSVFWSPQSHSVQPSQSAHVLSITLGPDRPSASVNSSPHSSARAHSFSPPVSYKMSPHGFIHKWWWLAPGLVSTSLRWTGGPAALRLPLR